MTRQAKLVIAPESLRPLAAGWSEYGLTGEVAWLDSEGIGVGLTLSQWQTAQAWVLRPGYPPLKRRLMEYLSALEGVRSTLVVWLRSPADIAAGLASVEDFIQFALPSNLQRVRMDLINPDELGEAKLPPAVQGWRQYVIATQDNPEPGSPDAGWEPTRAAVAIHSLFALAGALGGDSVVSGDTAERPQFVLAFSRHLSGGREARATALRYLDEELPTSDASDVARQRFIQPLQPELEVDRALEWLRGVGNGALRYTPPLPIDPRRGLTPAVEVRYEGWLLAFQQLLRTALPRGLDAQLGALARQREDIATRLLNAQSEEGERPSREVWQSVFRLITCIVDGGAEPVGFRRQMRTQRELVLPAGTVDPEPSFEPASYSNEATLALPQLQSLPPWPIAQDALHGAASTLAESSPPLADQSNPGSIGQLVRIINSQDSDIRTQQANGLAGLQLIEGDQDPPVTPKPERLVDRLYRDVLQDCIRAQKDSVRWHELALSDWRMSLKPGRLTAWLLILAGVAVGGAGSWAWSQFGHDWNVQLAMSGYEPIPVAIGYAVPITLALLLMATGLAGLAARIRRLFLDARHQLELRELLAERAEFAYREHARLDHAARIMGHWWTIFRRLYRTLDSEPVPQPPSPPEVPASMQLGAPTVHANYAPTMVAKAAATSPGWRARLVFELAKLSLSKYHDVAYGEPDPELFDDSGMPEGALDRVARDLGEGSVWPEWHEREVGLIAGRLRDLMLHSEMAVDRPAGQTVAEFLGEALQAAEVLPGIHQWPVGQPEPKIEARFATTENAQHFPGEQPRQRIKEAWTTGAVAVQLAFAPLPAAKTDRSTTSGRSEPFDDMHSPKRH